MNGSSFRRWAQFLRDAGLSSVHSAFILGVDVAAVEAVPDRSFREKALPRLRRIGPTGRHSGPIRGPNATKLFRMRSLGYSIEQMACILQCRNYEISRFLDRVTALDGTLLKQPRTRNEQREFEDGCRRAAAKIAAKAAKAAIKAAAWSRVSDAECDRLSVLVPPAVVAEPEPSPVPEPSPAGFVPAEPTRWNRSDNFKARGPRALTPAQIQQGRELLLSGLSYRQVARHLNVSTNTLRRLAPDVGPRPRNPRTITAAQIERGRQLLMSGQTYRVVAAELGVCEHTLRRNIKDIGPRSRGGEANGSSKLTWEKVDQMRRLRTEGASFAALGRQFGVDANTAKDACLGGSWKRHSPPLLAQPYENSEKPRETSDRADH